jgi:hypothetical protein
LPLQTTRRAPSIATLVRATNATPHARMHEVPCRDPRVVFSTHITSSRVQILPRWTRCGRAFPSARRSAGSAMSWRQRARLQTAFPLEPVRTASHALLFFDFMKSFTHTHTPPHTHTHTYTHTHTHTARARTHTHTHTHTRYCGPRHGARSCVLSLTAACIMA